MTLEQILEELDRYSEPNIHRLKSGWWCNVNLRVKVAGAKFEVAGDILPTPKAAAEHTLSRVRDILRDLHKSAAELPYNEERPAITQA